MWCCGRSINAPAIAVSLHVNRERPLKPWLRPQPVGAVGRPTDPQHAAAIRIELGPSLHDQRAGRTCRSLRSGGTLNFCVNKRIFADLMPRATCAMATKLRGAQSSCNTRLSARSNLR
jgi:hypothetical protein